MASLILEHYSSGLWHINQILYIGVRKLSPAIDKSFSVFCVRFNLTDLDILRANIKEGRGRVLSCGEPYIWRSTPLLYYSERYCMLGLNLIIH